MIAVIILKLKSANARRFPFVFEERDPSIPVIVVPIFAQITSQRAFSLLTSPIARAVITCVIDAVLDCMSMVATIPTPANTSSPGNPSIAKFASVT
jgi:hypothetical protein